MLFELIVKTPEEFGARVLWGLFCERNGEIKFEDFQEKYKDKLNFTDEVLEKFTNYFTTFKKDCSYAQDKYDFCDCHMSAQVEDYKQPWDFVFHCEPDFWFSSNNYKAGVFLPPVMDADFIAYIRNTVFIPQFNVKTRTPFAHGF